MAVMKYDDKVALWKSFVSEKKIPLSYAGYPVLIVTRFGHEPAPLMFWKTWQITALLGVNYAFGWGLCMHYLAWQDTMSGLSQVGCSIGAGAMFGLMMALLGKRQFRKQGLTSWDKFCEDNQNIQQAA
jgi:hypothetical protein